MVPNRASFPPMLRIVQSARAGSSLAVRGDLVRLRPRAGQEAQAIGPAAAFGEEEDGVGGRRTSAGAHAGCVGAVEELVGALTRDERITEGHERPVARLRVERRRHRHGAVAERPHHRGRGEHENDVDARPGRHAQQREGEADAEERGVRGLEALRLDHGDDRGQSERCERSRDRRRARRPPRHPPQEDLAGEADADRCGQEADRDARPRVPDAECGRHQAHERRDAAGREEDGRGARWRCGATPGGVQDHADTHVHAGCAQQEGAVRPPEVPGDDAQDARCGEAAGDEPIWPSVVAAAHLGTRHALESDGEQAGGEDDQDVHREGAAVPGHEHRASRDHGEEGHGDPHQWPRQAAVLFRSLPAWRLEFVHLLHTRSRRPGRRP